MQRREFIALLGGVAAACRLRRRHNKQASSIASVMLETTGEAVNPLTIGAFRKVCETLDMSRAET